jgi:hypothetical protein
MDVTRASHDSVVALLTGSVDIEIVVQRMSSQKDDKISGSPQENDKKPDASSSSESDSDEDSSSEDEKGKSTPYVEYDMEPLAKAASLRNINARVGDKSPAAVKSTKTNQTVEKHGQVEQPHSAHESFEYEIEPQARTRSVKKNISQVGERTEVNTSVSVRAPEVMQNAAPATRQPASRSVAPPPVSPTRTIHAIGPRTSAVQEVEAAPALAAWAPAGPVLMPPSAAESMARIQASPVVQMKPLATSSMKRGLMNESVSSAEMSMTSGESSLPRSQVSKMSQGQPPVSPVFPPVSAAKPAANVSAAPLNGDAVSQLFMKIEKSYMTPPSQPRSARTPNADYRSPVPAHTAEIRTAEPYPVEVLPIM